MWNHDEVIRQNVLAYNRDVQTWGWFDVDDQRHWPAALQNRSKATSRPLSLEGLKLSFSQNVYAYAIEGAERALQLGRHLEGPQAISVAG